MGTCSSQPSPLRLGHLARKMGNPDQLLKAQLYAI